MRDARPLHILCIDDKPPSFDGFSELHVILLRSLTEVERRLRGGDEPMDIVLCDVNMKERNNADHPKSMNLIWGEENADPAYGPLLALPFLKADSLCQFVPRSSYWSHVASSGYVLVAMSIVRSLIEKRDIGLADTRAWIESRALSTDIILNVNEGLQGFRQKIEEACKNGRISVSGIESARKAIAAWEPGSPLVEIDGCPVHLEIVYTDRIDRIKVVSIFSDLIEHQAPTSTEQAKAICDELTRWYIDIPGFQFPKYDDIYDGAVQLLVNALPVRNRRFGNLKDRAREMSIRTGVNMHCLLRTVIVFAFARAWYFVHVNQAKRFHNTIRTNKNKKPGSEQRWGIMHWVYWFLDIDPEQSTPQNQFKRLLGTTGTPIKIGEGFYQRPFRKQQKANVLTAYNCLQEDEPADLLTIEKRLCLDFIKDNKRFYPAVMKDEEMKDEEKIPWNDLKDQDVDKLPPYPKWLIT